MAAWRLQRMKSLHPPLSGVPIHFAGKLKMATFRLSFGRMAAWLLLFILLAESTTQAGFVSIDTFTDSTQSDGLGIRTSDGLVQYEDGFVSLVSGHPEMDKVVSLSYSFIPAPLVVKPKFVLTAKNNQTNFLESGLIRVSVNGGSYIERELFAAKKDYEILVFDFTDSIPPSETVEMLDISWRRPDNTTGARQLLIQDISVSDVPEPRSTALVGCIAGIAIIVGSHKNSSVVTRRRRRRRREIRQRPWYCRW